MRAEGSAMWRRRRRLQQLETEIAQGKAERAELRRRLDWFETIAAAAGAVAPRTDPDSTALLSSGPPSQTLPRRVPLNQTASSATTSRAGQDSTAPSVPMPPNLLAAARDLRGRDIPVRLDVAGAEVIAVVGGPGDPQEWWRAIWQTAGPDAGPETADAEEAPA
jgi:hypothetical protein